ncbi:MAG: hypothetical protein GDA56_02440 [Hormoscilla sp. GM7CHS1pb]|nr:hypothetical protein [Hormoscilla sp. GM7CHS1pb]
MKRIVEFPFEDGTGSNILIPQAVDNEIANVGTIDVASANGMLAPWTGRNRENRGCDRPGTGRNGENRRCRRPRGGPSGSARAGKGRSYMLKYP